MNEYVDLLSKIVIWGGIAFIILFIILKALGIVKSPSLMESLLIFIVGELIRVENKLKEIELRLNLIWSDFKKRKKLSS
jgi:hypothetical protein